MNPSKVTRKLKRLKFSKNTKCGFFSKHWTGSLANWWKIELESAVKHEMEPGSVKGVVNSLFLPVREVLKDSRTLEIRLVWVRRITPSTSSIEWRCHDLAGFKTQALVNKTEVGSLAAKQIGLQKPPVCTSRLSEPFEIGAQRCWTSHRYHYWSTIFHAILGSFWLLA